MKSRFSAIFWFAAMAAVATAGCVSCTSSDRFLDADTRSIELSAEDDSATPIAVEASSSWIIDISDPVDWLDVYYAEDAPNLLWAKASVNEEIEERSAKITIVSGDGLALVIPVVQHAMVIRFEVSPQTLEPFTARDVNVQTLTVDTGLDWQAVQLHGDWIELTRDGETEDETAAGNTLKVGVTPTLDFEPRRDTIVLRPVREDYWAYGDSIVVVQAGIDLVVTGAVMDEDTFEIAVPAEGGEIPLSVFSRYAWSLMTDASAETVSFDLTSHEGGTIENGTPIVMTVAPNTSTEEDRIFTLTFESEGETYEYTCRQQKSDPPEEEQTPPEPQE